MARPAARNSHPALFDLIRRFNHSGGANENDSIANDPWGWDSLSEEEREDSGYPKVPFNMPGRSLPQANFMCIFDMSLEVLRRSGHRLEARQLERSLRLTPPRYDDLPKTLNLFLDFGPLPEPTPEQAETLRALAEQMGLSSLELSSKKKAPANPFLADAPKGLAAEAAFLRENVGVFNAYGKDALHHLSPAAASALVDAGLRALSDPAAPQDLPPFGDLDWFRKAYPLGFLSMDKIHDSALVSTDRPFGAFVRMATFELADKAARGFDPDDVRLYGWNHKNRAGVTGSAVAAASAFDFLSESFDAIVRPEAPAAPVGDAFCDYMKRLNPGFDSKPEAFWVWCAYRDADPEAAAFVESAWRDDLLAKNEKEGAEQFALYEQLAIDSASVRSFVPLGADPIPSPIPLAAARPRRPSL